MADESRQVTLVDEEGGEHRFTLLDVVELSQGEYVLLLPEDDPEEGVVILRVEEDDAGEQVLVDLDDDEFDRVVAELGEEDDEGSDRPGAGREPGVSDGMPSRDGEGGRGET